MVKVYHPKAEADQQELQRWTAEAHTEFVTAYIKKNCPVLRSRSWLWLTHS